MAKVRFIIGKRGGDRPEVAVRLTVSSALKIQKTAKGLTVPRAYWSDAKQCIDVSRKFIKPWEQDEFKAINKTLRNLTVEIEARCASALPEDLSKEWLAEQLDRILHHAKYEPKPIEPQKPPTLMEAFAKLIDSAPTRIIPKTGKPVTASTLEQYKNTQGMLGRYLKAHHRKDLELAELTPSGFYDPFVAWLYADGKKKNTIGKHIKQIKVAINALPPAQRVQCEFNLPKACPKLTEEVDNIYLTEDELQRIADLQLQSPYLDRVRDQFIMMAWTGVRYSDLPKLTRGNIHPLLGWWCFKLEQQKTGGKVTIPILPPVQAILDKYDYNLPAPVSSQKFNDWLKDVARQAELEEPVSITHTEQDGRNVGRVTVTQPKWQCVTAHTARRSFATNMYKRDFPTLEIMKITGHKTEASFLKYIKVTQDENAERMMARFMEQGMRK